MMPGHRGAYRLSAPLATISVPGTVQAILSARIDRLGEREKRVLQSAAVAGREFHEWILEAVVELSKDEQAMFDNSVNAVKGLVDACKGIDSSLA